MPEETTQRTFTEGEAYALVADAVARETAAANTEVEALKAANATLLTERDAMEVRATAAETAKAEAETALVNYKAEVETQKANEAKRTTRLAELAKVAPKLEVTQERSDRIVAMEDPAFVDYLETLRQVAGVTGEAGDKDKGSLPRESAAFSGGSGTGAGDTPTASVKNLFGAARALTTTKA